AYEDLGAEAILRLNVDNFPAIVANDIYGNDLFEQGKTRCHGYIIGDKSDKDSRCLIVN
ncbi:unnamed protein product, partial [marine sediment metagenome]